METKHKVRYWRTRFCGPLQGVGGCEQGGGPVRRYLLLWFFQMAEKCGEAKEKCREAEEGLKHSLSQNFAVSTQV